MLPPAQNNNAEGRQEGEWENDQIYHSNYLMTKRRTKENWKSPTDNNDKERSRPPEREANLQEGSNCSGWAQNCEQEQRVVKQMKVGRSFSATNL